MKLYRIGIATAALFLSAASLSASSAHTWVAATGSDSTGAGSMAKPYATFQQAVTNTTAGGIVSVLGPGDYGPVTITQSITIDGTGGGSVGFAGDSEGIYIDAAAAATINLRNLAIDGAGTGADAIFIASTTPVAVNVMIDGCRLEGFTQIGVGLGSEGPEYVVIRNTVISGGTLGVRTFQSSGSVTYDHVSLDHVTIQGATSVAVFTRNGNVDISNSNIVQSLVGIEADTSATLSVESTMITSNTNGVCIFSGSAATLHNTDLYDNTTAIEACGGTVVGAPGVGPSPKL
jgi:hypothetical protein